MVRLVFRPYTHVRRTICTSVSLRASTRVSPGFTLRRHSSPSFGSQRTRSYSNLSSRIRVGRCCCLRLASLTFITHVSFSTGILACTLDSLVRVTRRVGKDHFDRIAQSTLKPRSHRRQRIGARGPPDQPGLCDHATPSCLTTPRK